MSPTPSSVASPKRHNTMLKRNKFLLIGGPCVLESRKTSLLIGKTLRDLAHSLGWDYVFKASYDKANRTSFSSPRGPGFSKGLKELSALKRILKVPVLTDVHTAEEAKAAGKVVDILQIPAFLCRQTDLLIAARSTGGFSRNGKATSRGLSKCLDHGTRYHLWARRFGCRHAGISHHAQTGS